MLRAWTGLRLHRHIPIAVENAGIEGALRRDADVAEAVGLARDGVPSRLR